MIKMYNILYIEYRYSCPIILDYTSYTRISSTEFKKNLNCQISWKYVQWEPSCYRRTDMTKLIVVLRNSANAPKMTTSFDILYV
jgi:hypothetical protein